MPDQSSSSAGLPVADPPAQLWTVREVAYYLRLKPQTIRAMARRGELPVIRLGRGLRFQPGAIEAWLNSKQAQPDTGSYR